MKSSIEKTILPVLVSLAASAALACAQSTRSTGTLIQEDFNSAAPWPVMIEPKPGAAGVTAGKFGTIDREGSTEPSGGLLLTTVGGSRDGWDISLTSGPLGVENSESDPAKLTLAFDLSATRALPVKVIVESYDAQKQRTGGMETTITPAAADFYQRYALDLATMVASGTGTFDPTAPFIGFSFKIGSAAGWPASTRHRVSLDNVHYARPAYYVDPAGDDTSDGLTEATAFASPQRALDAAAPGDIILLKDGTYGRASDETSHAPVARFVRSGVPGAWITLKNYPGHRPQLSAAGQQAITINAGPKGTPQEDLAYLEVRGLHVRGDGDTAREKYASELGRLTPNTESRGIYVNGRKTPYPGERTPGEIVHHIRLADNLVEYCTGDGIYAEYADWLFLENNTVQNNCWATAGYAPAGVAVMGYANFDAADNVFKMLIADNIVTGNRLTVKNHPWGKAEKTIFFNGNGILLDDNAGKPAPNVYAGRTLVQNNLVHHNGAGGIQMWANHRMDLVNNTVALNGDVSPWGQIGFERCRDVRLVNNVIVARPDTPLDTWFVKPDKGTDRILRINNLYWGGVTPPVDGVADLVADPLFVNPVPDPATADFRLAPGSPAMNAGRWETFSPVVDIAGVARPLDSGPSLGAYQK